MTGWGRQADKLQLIGPKPRLELYSPSVLVGLGLALIGSPIVQIRLAQSLGSLLTASGHQPQPQPPLFAIK